MASFFGGAKKKKKIRPPKDAKRKLSCYMGFVPNGHVEINWQKQSKRSEQGKFCCFVV